MTTIIIDNREIDVPPGTKVIEAAATLGILIPRFCYHPALGSVGACRVCAVKFLDGPVKGIQMSCMVDAADGMVVSTTDAEAMDFRKHVVEWLMMNHPHDCPVCDEGGHCLLQDMTISGGHGIRRYPGLKRTYADQFLGPLIQQEMNRCIHCYRCARYYQEITGYLDFGVLRIGSRTGFGRFAEGVLESPFSGNLIDICPTGVFTDKPARYKGRRWDFERSPSVCIHCSLGCGTIVSARYREIIRQEAGIHPDVNGHFICDRGRFGFYYANLESRPGQISLEGRPSEPDTAFQIVAEKLDAIEQAYGTESVAALGAGRSSLETQAMLAQISRSRSWREPVYFMPADLAAKVKAAQAGLSLKTAASLRDVADADVIAVIGADPLNEAPMLAPALRRAQRKGARIVVIDPRPVELPLDFVHLPLSPATLETGLGRLIRRAVDRDAALAGGRSALTLYDTLRVDEGPSAFEAEIDALALALRGSQRPLVVCGTQAVPPAVPQLSAYFVQCLRGMEKAAGLFYLLPGANAFGAGLFSGEAGSFEQLLAAIEADRIRALIVVEADPFRGVSDPDRLVKALDRLALLVVLDHVHSEIMKKAHVVFPTQTIYEAGGVFINQEGRAQMAFPVHKGGTPIQRTGGGAHPPRDYRASVGSDCFPAWLALARMADDLNFSDQATGREMLWRWMQEKVPELRSLPRLQSFPQEGVQLLPRECAYTGESWDALCGRDVCPEACTGLMLMPVDRTFGTETLSRLSPCLQALETPPHLLMHVRDARRLQLRDGGKVRLELTKRPVEVTLRTSDRMAPGVMFISGVEAATGTAPFFLPEENVRGLSH